MGSPSRDPAEARCAPSPQISLVHVPRPSAISHKSLRALLQTIKLPLVLRLPHTATAPAFILVPVSPESRCSAPPLSPVNAAPAPVLPSSSPSGSLSDMSPVCTSPRAHEKCPVSESHAVPLTPAMPQTVTTYIRESKAHVRRACDDLGDGLTLSANYVDSKVIQRDAVQSGKNSNKSLDRELNVMGETDRRKCMVQLNQIFERRCGCRSKSYNLLVGKAGMGKTACVKKLCHDWSADCLPQFDFVFLLDAPLLAATEPKYGLETLLLQLSSSAPPCSNPDAVFAQILAAPKRTLIIFDGFEDLREFELLVQHLEKDVAKDRSAKTFTIRQLYSAILQRVVLRGCSLLLASRPRGSASQLLRKVDNILETSGFSPSDVEMYIKQYFPDPEVQQSAVKRLQNCSYLGLLCWNPGICRLVCTLLGRRPIAEDLPRTLTAICHQVLKMNGLKDEQTSISKGSGEGGDVRNATRTRGNAPRRKGKKQSGREEDGPVSELSCLAWKQVQMNSSIITKEFSISCKTRAAGLEIGLLNATRAGKRWSLLDTEKEKGNSDDGELTIKDGTRETEVCGREILCWANPFLQSFLAAVHLSLSSSACVKTLSFQTCSKGQRRHQREAFELTQRFAVGLLFHNQDDLLRLQPHNNSKTVVTKQKSLLAHLKHLQFDHLRPSQILDVCHFVYEGSFTHAAEDNSSSRLAGHVAKNLPQKLTFNGVPLSPADVHVIRNVLQHGGRRERRFSLDVRDCGIQVSGLRSLVGLDSVGTYRACIGDVVILWEELGKQKEDGVLGDVVSKFKIDPFKATQVSHIEHLAKLVDIHTNRRLPECQLNSIFAEGVLAVKDLHRLELELGPNKGPLALPMLWKLLPGLHNLQHLDLENNKIDDDGAQHLAKALVSLSSLETINLSQNTIGDTGAKSLSAALRNLPKLVRLSLHSNAIYDEGANCFAAVLPHMSALTELDITYNWLTDVGAQSLGSSLKHCQHMKTLRMWGKQIPYGAFERLKQQDHRIMDTF
ncbi:MHC class II transactivator [Eucyclogobius newberryi]|uniref:MHC class II transactivator n=1 Tax=Eucyclogobius newberryi TaxID=166745 RepID=UPI003B5B4377